MLLGGNHVESLGCLSTLTRNLALSVAAALATGRDSDKDEEESRQSDAAPIIAFFVIYLVLGPTNIP